MRLLKNRLFIGALCIALAAAVSFVLLPRYYAQKSETTVVVKAAEDIPAGTTITGSMIFESEVGAFGLPSGTACKVSEVIGMVAKESLYQGESLTYNRLVTAQEYEVISAEKTKGLTDSLCLVAIQLPSISSGLGNILRTGCLVDVYASEESGDRHYAAQKILADMYVYDVLNSNLQSLDSAEDLAPVYVIFRCTDSEAQTLIALEREKAMHLTLANTGR